MTDTTAARPDARTGGVDWSKALHAYNEVRPEHCRRVLATARTWLRLLVCGLDLRPTALTPEQEPEMFHPIPLTAVIQ